MSTDRRDAYADTMDAVSKGSLLPDSGMVLVSGTTDDGGRHPCATGYESERGLMASGGRVISEGRAAAEAAGLCCELCREAFEFGWRTAMHGFRAPNVSTTTAWGPRRVSERAKIERMGYDAYRTARGIVDVDPYAGFHEERARKERLEDQDDVTEDIKIKSKRRKRAAL